MGGVGLPPRRAPKAPMVTAVTFTVTNDSVLSACDDQVGCGGYGPEKRRVGLELPDHGLAAINDLFIGRGRTITINKSFSVHVETRRCRVTSTRYEPFASIPRGWKQ